MMKPKRSELIAEVKLKVGFVVLVCADGAGGMVVTEGSGDLLPMAEQMAAQARRLA